MIFNFLLPPLQIAKERYTGYFSHICESFHEEETSPIGCHTNMLGVVNCNFLSNTNETQI
jgi:hypothetical protein